MARIIHEIGELTAGALSDLLAQAAANGAGRSSIVMINKLRDGRGHRVTIELSDDEDEDERQETQAQLPPEPTD